MTLHILQSNRKGKKRFLHYAVFIWHDSFRDDDKSAERLTKLSRKIEIYFVLWQYKNLLVWDKKTELNKNRFHCLEDNGWLLSQKYWSEKKTILSHMYCTWNRQNGKSPTKSNQSLPSKYYTIDQSIEFK